jgi:cell fate (sporulation/competence/biofilm development) regulator YlbF (YheA/YmcA/DUF963 family)
VNFAQLKLSLHQAIELGKVFEKSVGQWEELVKHLGSHELSKNFATTKEHLASAISSLAKTMEEANRLSAHDDSVTITAVE